MENNYEKNSIYKNAMNYGLILGLAIVIYTMVLHFMGAGQNRIAAWGSVVFTAVAISVGNRTLRDKFQGGFISYGRSLGSAVLIAAFGGVIHGIFIYIFYSFISPESMQEIFIAMEENMLQQGSPEEQIEMAMKMAKSFTNPFMMSISAVFGGAFWGLIIGLIVSAFVKREQNIFDQQ